MSSSSDRKQELERKKAKLAQIREEKRRKEEEKARQLLQINNADERLDSSAALDKSVLAEETIKILSELGISPHAPETPTENAAPTGFGQDAPASRGSSSAHESSPASTTVYKTRGKVHLDKSTLTLVNLQPKEQVLYSKTTQTVGESGSSDKEYFSYEWDDEFTGPGGVGHGGTAGVGGAGARTSSSAGTQASPVEEVFPLHGLPSSDFFDARHIAAGLLPHIELVKPAEVRSDKTISDEKQHQQSMVFQHMTEEERQKILSDVEFQQFFDRASRILERAVTETEDNIFIDYSKDSNETKPENDIDEKLSLSRVFFEDKWAKGRCITSMHCNPQYPELLAVSYFTNNEAAGQPDGLVLVWNTKFKKNTPEYVFHCQSRVLSLTWAKFHPNLILGGTYSGQICLWDNRQNKRTPVQKSALSAMAHTHPVYCLKVVGTQNAHNLVSVSTDGKLCSWSLDMLAKPLETLDLTLKQSKQVAAMCIDFPQNDVNNFLMGAEDGCVYSGCRHGQKAGVVDAAAFEGHFGPVTGVACHAAPAGPIDFGSLFLTSSFDWTVKLWSTKEPKPLCSFENNSDYVMDVGWSPVHPALFAVADCRGRLDLWHLTQDVELPAATVLVADNTPINKLMWLPSGQQIVVGDDLGRVSIYDVNEQLALPKQSEWAQLAKVLKDVKQNQLEAEELAQAMALSAVTVY